MLGSDRTSPFAAVGGTLEELFGLTWESFPEFDMPSLIEVCL